MFGYLGHRDILEYFWVDLGIFGVIWIAFRIGIVSVFDPILGHFVAVLVCVLFDPFGLFLVLLGPKTGLFLGSKNCVQILKSYFEEDAYSYRSVKAPGPTDSNSSRYDPFLVTKRIGNLFRLYLFKSIFLQKSVCKPCVPASTVTRFWVFLDTMSVFFIVITFFFKPHWPFLTTFSSRIDVTNT